MSKTKKLLETATDLLKRDLNTREMLDLIGYAYDIELDSTAPSRVANCLLNVIPNYTYVLESYCINDITLDYVKTNIMYENDTSIIQSIIGDNFRLDFHRLLNIHYDKDHSTIIIVCELLDNTVNIVQLVENNGAIVSTFLPLEPDTEVKLCTSDYMILYSPLKDCLYKFNINDGIYNLCVNYISQFVTIESRLFFLQDWLLVDDSTFYCLDYEGNLIKQIDKEEDCYIRVNNNIGDIFYYQDTTACHKFFNNEFETPYIQIPNNVKPMVLTNKYCATVESKSSGIKVIVYSYSETPVNYSYKSYDFAECDDIDVIIKDNELTITVYIENHPFTTTDILN